VRELSPGCGTVGRFTVRGHKGLNPLRFAGRVGRERLTPGTYRISARTRDGRSVQHVIIVLVAGGAPSRTELTALRASNVCSARRGPSSTAANTSIGASNTGGISGDVESSSPNGQASASQAPRGENSHSGAVLASAVERTAEAIRPALVALLAAAILLLGLASLPRVALVDPRFGEVLERHRVELASLGAVALLAVLITLLVG